MPDEEENKYFNTFTSKLAMEISGMAQYLPKRDRYMINKDLEYATAEEIHGFTNILVENGIPKTPKGRVLTIVSTGGVRI